MNKSSIYAVVAVAMLVVVLAGMSVVIKNPGDQVQHAINNVMQRDLGAAVVEAVDVGVPQKISWNPADYSTSEVSIMIIRKVADAPARYDLVRTISETAPNNGSAVWIPLDSELGKDIYVQIGCVNASTSCHSNITSSPLNVAK